jgi:hypothetical protein
LFLGGVILIYLGIIGRYILVILDHLKRRPEYVIAADSGIRPARENSRSAERLMSDLPSDLRPEGRRASGL